MKVDELNQNTVISHVGTGRSEKHDPSDLHGETPGKQQTAAVKVELSSYIPVVPASQKQLEARASRLEELKSQISSGDYQVSSRAVAEKMLTRMVMATAH